MGRTNTFSLFTQKALWIPPDPWHVATIASLLLMALRVDSCCIRPRSWEIFREFQVTPTGPGYANLNRPLFFKTQMETEIIKKKITVYLLSPFPLPFQQRRSSSLSLGRWWGCVCCTRVTTGGSVCDLCTQDPSHEEPMHWKPLACFGRLFFSFLFLLLWSVRGLFDIFFFFTDQLRDFFFFFHQLVFFSLNHSRTRWFSGIIHAFNYCVFKIVISRGVPKPKTWEMSRYYL